MTIKGLTNVPVEEYTTPSPIFSSPDSPLENVAIKMAEGGFRHVPVLQDNKVVGVVSDRELRVAMEFAAEGQALQVKDIMNKDPYITSPQTSIEEVVFEMSSRKIGSSIVVDELTNYLGIFTSIDALNAMVEIMRGDVEC